MVLVPTLLARHCLSSGKEEQYEKENHRNMLRRGGTGEGRRERGEKVCDINKLLENFQKSINIIFKKVLIILKLI